MAAVQSERDLLKARLNDLEAQNGLLIVEKRRAEDLLASLGLVDESSLGVTRDVAQDVSPEAPASSG